MLFGIWGRGGGIWCVVATAARAAARWEKREMAARVGRGRQDFLYLLVPYLIVIFYVWY